MVPENVEIEVVAADMTVELGEFVSKHVSRRRRGNGDEAKTGVDSLNILRWNSDPRKCEGSGG